MSKRRNVKRVDYSKFSTSGPSSDSEDDFQEVSSPKSKKTNKSLERKKKNVTHKQPEKDSLIRDTKRLSRTSNADQLFERDLMTAIVSSKNDASVELPADKCQMSGNEVVSLSDSDDEDKVINNIINKRNTRSVMLNDSFAEITTDSSVPDTVPYEDNTTTPPAKQYLVQSSPLKQNVIQSSPLKEYRWSVSNISTTETLKGDQDEGITHVKRTPKLSCTNRPSTNNTPKHLTPGRLRLGLSRNIRVAKPLHTHVVLE